MGEVLQFPVRAPVGKPIVSAESDLFSEILRDQWDRPLIQRLGHVDHGSPCGKKTVDGAGKQCLLAYRRASTVAEVLDGHYGLDVWKRRLTAQGLAQRPDLLQAIHVARAKRELDEIAEEAFVAAGGDSAARNGTTLHGLTDQLNRGQDVPSGLPSNIVAMLEKYEIATRRFTYIDGERFVVQDTIQVAGTYDSRYRDEKTGELYIGDLKSGQDMDYLSIKLPAQVAVYASGRIYDLIGTREDHGANRDRGLLIHLPWVEKAEDAVCHLKWLDLRVGRAAIREAFRVEAMRKIKSSQTMLAVKD